VARFDRAGQTEAWRLTAPVATGARSGASIGCYARGVTEGRLPLHDGIDALHAWARSPTARRRADVRRALSRLAAANGLAGAHLDVDAIPLPALSLGVGTLRRRPSSIRPPLQTAALAADDGRVPLGRLIIDPGSMTGADDQVEQAARAIELALDAAWARAEVRHVAERMAALDVATRAITSELDVETVLQLIVDRVRDLAEARYAALGIVDAEGQIDRFITSGLDAAERARIGDLPRGRGLLGLIIREGRPYLIPDIAHDPRRSGFPPGHPPMHSFIGVPVVVRGEPVGNLYLTDRRSLVMLPSPSRTLDCTSASASWRWSRSASASGANCMTASSSRSTASPWASRMRPTWPMTIRSCCAPDSTAPSTRCT
jgi:hypothetical protein